MGNRLPYPLSLLRLPLIPSPITPYPFSDYPLSLLRLPLAHPMNSCIFAAAIGGIAQLARALAWHARGHRFESDYLHFKNPERVDFQRVRDFFLRFMPHLCHILRVFSSRVGKIFAPNAAENRMIFYQPLVSSRNRSQKLIR